MPEERHDPAELAAAEAVDARIAAELASPGAGIQDDPAVAGLVTALRVEVPEELRRRVADEVAAETARTRRSWWVVQVAAAAMAAILASHGLGNLIDSEWIAEGLGEPHGRHAWVEGGLALLAASVAVGAGLFHRRMLPVSVAVGSPLGIVLGIRGIDELGQFGAGAALHLTQGVLGIVLLVTFWRARRYGSGRAGEGGA
jgi:hypothetical protein